MSDSSLFVFAQRCAVVRCSAWAEPIEAWLSSLRAAGRPATTVRLRRYQLERLAEGVAPAGPWDVSGEQLLEWLADQDWSAETRRSWRAALRSFYGWALDAGRNNCDPSRVVPAVKPTEPNPRPTPEEHLRSALAAAGERERLMVRMAAELGMRRGEVAVAHSRDLHREPDGWCVTVHGKGNKIRHVPVDVGLAAMIRERPSGYLFPGNDRGHLSPHYVGKLISRLLPDGWAMHSLRHRFGTAAFEVEHDLATVQLLMGHASIVTTIRYVKRPSDAMRRTVYAIARL